MKKTIGIIGYGNMGSAIAGRIKDNYDVIVFDKDKNKTGGLSGITVANNEFDLLKQSNAVVLAVKPQDFQALLAEIKEQGGNKLIISIAAGITTAYLEKALGPPVRVVRVMPNIGAKTGDSVTVLSKGRFAGENDFIFAKKIFDSLGTTKEIEEAMMDAATAVSGSGPAYVCDSIERKEDKEEFIDKFEKAAEGIGFSREDAVFLVNNTYASTMSILRKTKEKPAELKKQVASKGGTTEAGLKVLTGAGSLADAVKAALKRAQELSRS